MVTMKLLDPVRNGVRAFMRRVASLLNRLTGGTLTPNMVTVIGLLAHAPIAWLIATHHPIWAAVLLLIFGLFDTLDGELARLQGRTTHSGMFLDSVTDRIKEMLVYIGLMAAATSMTSSCVGLGQNCWYSSATYMVLLVVALGGSLLTSYINAWGEAVLRGSKVPKTTLNKTFRGGIASFEVRMFLLVIMLLFGWEALIIPVIAILAWYTALGRMYRVIETLSNVQD
jgi:phosphatidylglycerophosphate synthase